MITRAGVLLLGGAAVLVATGRLLGLVELYVLAGAGALAVAGAVVRLRLSRPAPRVRRSVRPTRVHVGSPARIEIEVEAGARRTPVLSLVDPVGDRVGARLHLAPVAAGQRARAAYRLPTRRRGEIAVGPLRIEATDPFGLARWSRPAAPQVRLLVLPHVDVIPPLRSSSGLEPLAGSTTRPRTGHAGDEFHSLRPYVVGDDLRRVHWPMSARADDLVVRLDDEPRHGRLVVVLDVDAAHASPDTFEHMVSAAASILTAHRRSDDRVRLLCTDGRDTGWATGTTTFDGLLEVLATTQRAPGADLAGALARAGRSGSLVVVVGDRPGGAGLDRAALRRAATDTAAVVAFSPSATPLRLGGLTVAVAPGQSFPEQWADALGQHPGRASSRARAR